PYSTRPPGDPVVQLVTLLKAWIAQGKPGDVFTVPGAGGGGKSPFVLSDWQGDHQTNLGDCVPAQALVAARPSRMDDRGRSVPAPPELPDRLADTDLDPLDGATLAQEGVIGYAPTYPLWSDSAGKLRQVRVPHGQSIAFDAATQTFHIPPNTRFYK